jgi:hypothetical protein
MPRQLALLVSLVLASRAGATGHIVDAVATTAPEDAIPGLPAGAPYTTIRGVFEGTLQLPHDATGRTYAYSLPVWIVTPTDPAAANGTVLLDVLHTNAIRARTAVPSGREGERALTLMTLQPTFVFGRGYTWVAIRWDPAAFPAAAAALRYDHVNAPRFHASPGALPAGVGEQVGMAAVADLARALRSGTITLRGETEARPFAGVEVLIATGTSQTARLLQQIIHEPPNVVAGEGPLFDGVLLMFAWGAWDRWPLVDALGAVIPRPSQVRAAGDPPVGQGVIVSVVAEQDVGPNGTRATAQSEFLRFPDAPGFGSYELAGSAHIERGARTVTATGVTRADGSFAAGAPIFRPDLAAPVVWDALVHGIPLTFDLGPSIMDPRTCGLDTATGLPPLDRAGLQPVCTNPHERTPIVRALLVALEEKIAHGAPLPPNAWLENADETPAAHGSVSTAIGPNGLPQPAFASDALGNTLGGIREPFLAAGVGRFYARHPLMPARLNGTYADRAALGAPPRSHGAFVRAVAHEARALVVARFLLAADAEAIVQMAAESPH